MRNSQMFNLSSVIFCRLSFYAEDPYFQILIGVLGTGNKPAVATSPEAGSQWDLCMMKLTVFVHVIPRVAKDRKDQSTC